MKRRHFMQSMATLLAAGCTSGQLKSSTPPAAEAGATSAPTTTPAVATVDALPSPEVDLPDGAFGLGVASGSPTGDSVILWTRFVGELADEIPLVWELAADDQFESILVTGQTTAVATFGHSVHVDVSGLPSATEYYYRFRAGTQTSPLGRTQTMPAPGATVDQLRLGFSSCQLWETGHYAAHRDIAAADLDAVVWLGDFIYEYVLNIPGEVRPLGGGEAITLDDYRDRYAIYRSDPLLQQSSAAHPWFMTWDDHEVKNDYDRHLDNDRKTAAYQAWWENMPARIAPPLETAPVIYDSTELGTLVNLIVLDCRQEADADALLSEEQWAWFEQRLAEPATWTVICSSVLVSGTGVPELDDDLINYTWAGHPRDRDRLATALRSVANPVIVSGDMHAAMELKFLPTYDLGDPTLAIEFMAPAISSPFWDDYIDLAPLLPLVSPTVGYVEPTNGWLELTFTPTSVEPTFRFVDDVAHADSAITADRRRSHPAG